MKPSLWVTYAHVDNNDEAFDYVVQRLEEVGIDARFDKVALVPGQRLWRQIGERILDPTLDGWGFLVTPASVESEACIEELAYALDRALVARGTFPIIGLFHGLPFGHAPPAIRVRLGVSLSSKGWPAEVKAGLLGQAPARESPHVSPFKIIVRPGLPGVNVMEVTPRVETFHRWAVGVPAAIGISSYATGPAGLGYPVTIFERELWRGTAEIEGETWNLVSSLGPITPSTSAFLTIDAVPERVCAGTRNPPSGLLVKILNPSGRA